MMPPKFDYYKWNIAQKMNYFNGIWFFLGGNMLGVGGENSGVATDLARQKRYSRAKVSHQSFSDTIAISKGWGLIYMFYSKTIKNAPPFIILEILLPMILGRSCQLKSLLFMTRKY